MMKHQRRLFLKRCHNKAVFRSHMYIALNCW